MGAIDARGRLTTLRGLVELFLVRRLPYSGDYLDRSVLDVLLSNISYASSLGHSYSAPVYPPFFSLDLHYNCERSDNPREPLSRLLYKEVGVIFQSPDIAACDNL